MKLAIADPPYLGRAVRWYGGGRGSGGGRHVPDFHPQAAVWDDPAAHRELVGMLCEEFDGWAIAAAADSLQTYLDACPHGVRVMAWHRRNAPPSGARMRNAWEPVIVFTHPERRGRAADLDVLDDVLDLPGTRGGFVGAKPPGWTRWVLAALGYRPGTDELVDIFHGSGSVAAAADGMLELEPARLRESL